MTPNDQQPPSSHDVTDYAASAMQRMKDLGLSPSPQVYEVWFRYFQGENNIVRAIDAHSGKIDNAACVKIYKRYLNEAAPEEAVEKVSGQVQASIAELAAMLGSVRSATAEYGETLDVASLQIQKITTADELEMVVNSIVNDTKRMVEKNHDLEVQLVNSSKQVNELKTSLDSIKKEVLTDGLTGLYNRKAFDKLILEAMEESDTTKTPLIMMLLDIDHFKKFNDSYGHQTGDQVLRLVAKVLTDNVKGRDLAARYGGEEFAIILPETPLAAGLKVAESLRRHVESKEIVNKATNKTLGKITLSIGVAEYHSDENLTDLIQRSDAALYKAKNLGRNRIQEADPVPAKK